MDIVKLLIENGANVNSVIVFGMTTLHHAVVKGMPFSQNNSPCLLIAMQSIF